MGDNTLRRMSNTDTGKKLMRTETRRAMQRGVNEFDQRRQTVRNRRYLAGCEIMSSSLLTLY